MKLLVTHRLRIGSHRMIETASFAAHYGTVFRRGLFLFAAMLFVLTHPGCSWREETEAERIAREDAEKKARLEQELAKQTWILPAPTMQPGTFEAPSLAVKPGHWNGLTQPINSGPKNEKDFDGRLKLTVTNSQGDPLELPRTSFQMASGRPVVVARQSSKDIESYFFCPPSEKPVRLKTEFSDRNQTAPEASLNPMAPLLDHQYHFVVLAKEPERYGFLNSLYAVTSNLPSEFDTTQLTKRNSYPAEKNYRVVAIPAVDTSRGIALPDNPLAWSTIAYLLWDEVDPATLRAEQREALVDWINWGGQLIVNGPDSLDLLKGSFLEPHLPALGTGAREISEEDLSQSTEWWGVSKRGSNQLAIEQAWSGVNLKLNRGSSWLPNLGGLLAERRVGRGRVVVSGFQLAERELVNWKAGIDNLYNAAIMRRPPRFFGRDTYDDQRPVVYWLSGPKIAFDPLRNTKVRFFSRDLYKDPNMLLSAFSEGSQYNANNPGWSPNARFGGGNNSAPVSTGQGNLSSTGSSAASLGGVGSWSDSGLAAKACRSALRQSAGVTIPGTTFVVICLGAYLLLIAPLNWFFFSALGRVELAWLAAPVMALVGAVVVVQQAQLDIGFVRSQTEVALLEIQPDTPRAILTRFNGLYTSLSTTYEFEFDDSMAFATPFPRQARIKRNEKLGQINMAIYERQEKARLRGIAVSSNATEFVRSEQMIDLTKYPVPGSSQEGGVLLIRSERGGARLVNRLEWPLRHVVVVQRPEWGLGTPLLEGCWIGELEPGQSSNVAFSQVVTSEEKAAFAQERKEAIRVLESPTSELDLEELFQLALDPNLFEPGERRVIALIDQSLPGLTVTPESSQQHGSTLLVAHLAYGPLPVPKLDKNVPTEVVRRTIQGDPSN